MPRSHVTEKMDRLSGRRMPLLRVRGRCARTRQETSGRQRTRPRGKRELPALHGKHPRPLPLLRRCGPDRRKQRREPFPAGQSQRIRFLLRDRSFAVRILYAAGLGAYKSRCRRRHGRFVRCHTGIRTFGKQRTRRQRPPERIQFIGLPQRAGRRNRHALFPQLAGRRGERRRVRLDEPSGKRAVRRTITTNRSSRRWPKAGKYRPSQDATTTPPSPSPHGSPARASRPRN